MLCNNLGSKICIKQLKQFLISCKTHKTTRYSRISVLSTFSWRSWHVNVFLCLPKAWTKKKKKMYARFRNVNLSYFWWCLCLVSNGADILMFVYTNRWFDYHRLCILSWLFARAWPIFRIQKIKWIIDFMGIFTNITYIKFMAVNIDWIDLKLIQNILVY